MVWGLSYLDMTQRRPPELTPEEKFEESLPEAVRLSAINAEQNPGRKEQLIHSRQIVQMQKLAAEQNRLLAGKTRARNSSRAYNKWHSKHSI
jgi:hypothetical protein